MTKYALHLFFGIPLLSISFCSPPQPPRGETRQVPLPGVGPGLDQHLGDLGVGRVVGGVQRGVAWKWERKLRKLVLMFSFNQTRLEWPLDKESG